MELFTHIPEQLDEVRERVAAAAKKCGRDPESVKLIAVSKTFPGEAVETAYGAEQRLFGENKVQELELKHESLPDDIEWHLIGHLQSNKVVKAVAYADYIHAVDSEKLVKRIDRLAGEAGTKPRVLIEVNVSGEESKFGLSGGEETIAVAEAAAQCENVEFVGLMTMAPYGASVEELKSVFSGLRALRDRIQEKLKIELPELSMGMSSDFEIAVEEGATFVRVGTAIFGKRDYSK